MADDIRCPHCGSDDVRQLARLNPSDLHECEGCGYVFKWRRKR